LVRRGDRTGRLPPHRLRTRNAGPALMGRDGGFAPAPGKPLCPPGRLEAAHEAREDRGQVGQLSRSKQAGRSGWGLALPTGARGGPRSNRHGVQGAGSRLTLESRLGLADPGACAERRDRGVIRPTRRGHRQTGCPVRSSGATRGPGGSGPYRGARLRQSSKPWQSSREHYPVYQSRRSVPDKVNPVRCRLRVAFCRSSPRHHVGADSLLATPSRGRNGQGCLHSAGPPLRVAPCERSAPTPGCSLDGRCPARS
jgi:hypothetical protein